ncbi:stage II sporulation protein M [Micromonospora arida]|uniref:Stage II sporulation protein M n=1 Tax=Micromonospora arida TaxID=2203715 RepID=A0A3N9XTV7_9ACTN|nr:stage II sporulation protein M [Micromonospora arida]RQX10893.1 hypothetical protein DLJ58_10270 [Micromonospora arida]
MTVAPTTAPPRARPAPFGLTFVASAAIYLVLAGFAAWTAWADTATPLTPRTSDASTWDLLLHNMGVLVWLAGGLCTAGLLTGAVLGLNGILLGWVVGKQLAAGDGAALLTGMLPHLPFEITAYLISAAASIRFGLDIAGRLRRRSAQRPVPWAGWVRVQAYALVLLIVAALVEANVSHV